MSFAAFTDLIGLRPSVLNPSVNLSKMQKLFPEIELCGPRNAYPRPAELALSCLQ